jgi:hypothetical protein
MEDWEKIINELDDATNSDVDGFIAAMEAISQGFYEKVLNSATQLKLRIGKNKAKSSDMAENLKKLVKINAQLKGLLMETGYNKEVSTYIGHFKESQKAINTYYSTIISSYEPSSDLFAQIRKANVDTTVESLIGAGIDSNYIEPIKKILRDVVVGNGDYARLSKSLKSFIVGDDNISPRLKSYAGQVADDSIRQFQANYLKAVSDDLGLEHYLYRGTAISDTREFCQERHGHFYTKEEVESWPNHPWKGMVKGTNSVTIYTYRGGYRCRHSILPVSKTIYDAKK